MSGSIALSAMWIDSVLVASSGVLPVWRIRLWAVPVVEDKVCVRADAPGAAEQDRGSVKVVERDAPGDGDGEVGAVEGDVLAWAELLDCGRGCGLLAAGGRQVRFGVAPVVRGFDAGLDAGVLAQEVEEVGAVEELDGFAVGELVGGFAITAGGDQDALGGALVLKGAEQVADRGDADSVAVALCLDDDFASHDRSRVDGDAVDAAVAGGPGLAGVQAHTGEQVLDQPLELGRSHREQVGALVQAAYDVALLDEPRVGHVEFEDRADRGELIGFAGTPAPRWRRQAAGSTRRRSSSAKVSRVVRRVSRQGRMARPVAGSLVATMPLSTIVSMCRQRSASKISSTTRRAVWAMTEAYWALTWACGRGVSVMVSEALT